MACSNLNEKAYGTRLSRLLVDKGTEAMRNTFDNIHPPGTLAAVLKAKVTQLQKLRYKFINKPQWDYLYPASGNPDSKNFDITLLMILLRNICGLPTPASGWGSLPPDPDRSVEANILRIKLFRNEVYAHVTSIEKDDAVFKILWVEISRALLDLGIPQHEIDELKVCPLSPEEETYVEQLKAWKRAEDESKEIMKEILHGVKRTHQNTEQLVSKLKILPKLAKHNFDGNIESLVKSFHEGSREWLFKKLEDWFADEESRVMILTAGPGVGKSVFAAKVCEMYENKDKLAACHFCKFSNSNLSNPQLMLQSLARHMCANVKGFEYKLLEQLKGPHKIRNLEDAFCIYLNEPLQNLDTKEPMLIVIDGLDECEVDGKSQLLELIAEEFSKLPKWIKFLITSRPEIPVKAKLRHLNPFEILPNDENNRADLQRYFDACLPELSSNEKAKMLLVEKCQGSFLFAFYAQQLSRTQKLSVEAIDDIYLPEMLVGALKANAEDESNEDKKSFELYQEAIKYGEKKNNRISLLFIGHCGVGKTSLKKSLLGAEFDETEPSTVGIEFDVVEVNETNKSKPWQRSTDMQFMASEAYSNSFILNDIAKREGETRRKREDSDDKDRGVEGKKRRTVEKTESERTKKGGERVAHETHGSKNDGEAMNATSIKKNSFLSDDLKHKITQVRLNVDQYRDDTMDTIRFLVGDVGGQSVYYDIHSIMLRLRSLFILVIDLEKPFYDQARPTFVRKETKEVVEMKNPMKETNFDYVKKWLAALGALRTRKETNLRNADKAYLPKFIVVFTKPDNLKDVEAERRKNEACNALGEHFVAKFIIKNSLPRNEEETRHLEELREKIFVTAQGILLDQEPTPINWLVLERTLGVWMKSEHKKVITLNKARELGEECEVKKTFDMALKDFHEENIVVHFDDELVVLDPAWLVELMTQVITVPPDRHCDGKGHQAWRRLKEQGVLNFECLPNQLNEHSQKKDLKKMMEKAGLICHWVDDLYYVPSMVIEAMEKENIESELSHCLHRSMYIVFHGECIPLGFFTRIQVECLKWCLCNADNSKAPRIFCNFCRFYQEEESVTYTILLVRHMSRIQVAMSSDNQDFSWGNAAKSVLSFLRKTVHNICQNHPSFKSIEVKFGLKCGFCHLNYKCERHQKKSCTDEDCAFILELEHFQKDPTICNNDRERHFVERSTGLHESLWVKAAGNELTWNSNEVLHNTKGIAPPPELNISPPLLAHIKPTHVDWSSIDTELPMDLLLVTVKDIDLRSCYVFLDNKKECSCPLIGKVYFGKFGGGKVKVALIRCAQGSSEPCASLNVVNNALQVLKPKAVICVGCCGMVDHVKANLGDVVISAKLATYSNKKIKEDGTEEFYGMTTHISRHMGRVIPYAADGWEPPLKQPGDFQIKVHPQALMLSGPELVKNPKRRQEFLKHFPEAVAVEMEGEGLYAAAYNHGIEWAVVKGISNFADGDETAIEKWRLFGSVMAASIVSHMFKYPEVTEHW